MKCSAETVIRALTITGHGYERGCNYLVNQDVGLDFLSSAAVCIQLVPLFLSFSLSRLVEYSPVGAAVSLGAVVLPRGLELAPFDPGEAVHGAAC